MAGTGLFLFIFILITALIIAGFVFWIFMIVDVAKRQFPRPDDRIIWILIVVLAGFIGALIYYFVVKRKSP
jgi:hypothetical protein